MSWNTVEFFYGRYNTADDFRRMRREMERVYDTLNGDARIKQAEIIRMMDEAANARSGNLVMVPDADLIFPHDIVAIIDRMVREDVPPEIVIEALEPVLHQCPPEWAPKAEFPHEDVIFFWNRNEFISYVDYYQPTITKSFCWYFPSYSKAHYLMAYLLVELGRLEEALGNLRQGSATGR